MKRLLLLCFVAFLPVISFAQPLTGNGASKSDKDFMIKFEVEPFEYGVTSENMVTLIGYNFKKTLTTELSRYQVL